MSTLLPTQQAFARDKNEVCGRQVALFCAFLLPVYKLLELPSILARFCEGDLLLPALLHYIGQFCVWLLVVLAVKWIGEKYQKTPLALLEEKLGKWTAVIYIAYAIFYLFYAALPLLDLEKFVYAAFYDTAPTFFTFAFFFPLCGYVCAKGLKCMGRCADICLFLFTVPFAVLIAMSVFQADFTGLLPLFEKDFSATKSAFLYSTPHFLDVFLCLPLIGNLRYQKGDGKKLSFGYLGGAAFSLLFLAVFYGIFSTTAPRQHYAFLKIAQYFPALSVVGRIDLIFVYILSAVLFFFTCAPLLYATYLFTRSVSLFKKTPFVQPDFPLDLHTDSLQKALAALISIAAFFFTLFMNKHYDGVYALFGGLYPLFWIVGSLLPLLFLVLAPKPSNEKREKSTRKKGE